MRVLVADAFEQSGIDALTAAGCEVLYQPALADAALADALRSTAADVLVVRSTKVTGAMLDAGKLSLVVRAGAGVNTIDVAAASRRGIYVSNTPAKNATAVAELAFALILALDRRVPDNVADLRAGRWNKKEYSNARGLYGRTLGLLGFGSIGQEMARRAHGFGMPVVVWSRRFATDRGLTPATSGTGVRPRTLATSGGVSPLDEALLLDPKISVASSPEDLAARADVLSVHLALTDETRQFVGREILSRLKPGSFFINTARAEIVDPAALAEAVKTRNIRVGLDVHTDEPAGAAGEFRDPLVGLPGLYGTHHIGASTDQAQEAIAAEAVRVILSYKETGKVPNVVNLARITPATHMLVVRHRDRPGVLAHVFEHLREAHVNVQETENIIFEGAEAAVARINLDREPSQDVLQAIANGDNILNLHLVKI